jgi:hypothetical protein
MIVLNARARDVGRRLGWQLHFRADSDPGFVGLTAGAKHVFVLGPVPLTDLHRADIESLLDELQHGTRRIIDGDGNPHLI